MLGEVPGPQCRAVATGEAARITLGSFGGNQPGLLCSNSPGFQPHGTTAQLSRRSGLGFYDLPRRCLFKQLGGAGGNPESNIHEIKWMYSKFSIRLFST